MIPLFMMVLTFVSTLKMLGFAGFYPCNQLVDLFKTKRLYNTVRNRLAQKVNTCQSVANFTSYFCPAIDYQLA
jgi:hypothetical protein